MSILSTSAGTVAYDSHGSGDPIVLLPSGGHEHHDYDEIRTLLPGGFRSIGVDWPGHGMSPAGTAPSTELRLAQIVEELLDSLTPAGAVLVGNSVGGNVAARLAIRRPDLVKGLMIIDGGGFEGSQLSGRVFCALMSRPRVGPPHLPPVLPGVHASAHRRRPPVADPRHRDHAHHPRGDGGHRDLAQLQPPRARPPGPGREDHRPHRADLGTATTPSCRSAPPRRPGT